MSKLGKYAVASTKLAGVLHVAASSTGIFACVYKFTAAIERGGLFEELPVHFRGAVVTGCGQADGGKETCTKLGRWSLQTMLLFVEEMCL